MKIGLFGGTFDPVHHGHLILARAAVEQLRLDRLIFIPNAISPHKQAERPAPDALRMEMVCAAVAGEAGFETDGTEIRRGGTSYAIDTVDEMEGKYPGAEFFYLVGRDNVAELPTWRRYEELRLRVRFAVLSRGGERAAHLFPIVERSIEISSTEIRKRVAKGLSIRYLVPEGVLALIERHKLYKET